MFVPLIELQKYFGCSDSMELLANKRYSDRLANTPMWIDGYRIYLDRKHNGTLTFIEPRVDGLYETLVDRGVLERIKIDVKDFTLLTGVEYELNFKPSYQTPDEEVEQHNQNPKKDKTTGLVLGVLLTCVTLTIVGMSAYRAYTKDTTKRN